MHKHTHTHHTPPSLSYTYSYIHSPQRPTQLIVVHVRLGLAFAPALRHLVGISQLEFAVGAHPCYVRGIRRISKQLEQKLPQLDLAGALRHQTVRECVQQLVFIYVCVCLYICGIYILCEVVGFRRSWGTQTRGAIIETNIYSAQMGLMMVGWWQSQRIVVRTYGWNREKRDNISCVF